MGTLIKGSDRHVVYAYFVDLCTLTLSYYVYLLLFGCGRHSYLLLFNLLYVNLEEKFF